MAGAVDDGLGAPVITVDDTLEIFSENIATHRWRS